MTGFTQALSAGIQVGTVSQCEEVRPGKECTQTVSIMEKPGSGKGNK